MLKVLTRLFDGNEREVAKFRSQAERVTALEPEISRQSDAELAANTVRFRERLSRGETLDSLLIEAFAVVREAARRTVNMRHFDVQVTGGMVLHQGRIAEMKTGEGKTLVATLPAYLNALSGDGVHIVTVNDYLATRDSEWMGQIYRFLGLDVGLIVHGQEPQERHAAYDADITFATNNELGFDYLRDNMVLYAEHVVQRPLNYAIVDEVDSILVDEARTPLIISGASDKSTELYTAFTRIAGDLVPEVDFTVDEKAHTVHPTEEGEAKVERMLGITNLSDPEHMEQRHCLIQALKARTLMKRDRDYVVKDGQVIIVDEFTGRLMFGRRYSDGLHQAIESKEKVRVERESQTLASITFQNYFRMYRKLAGMTGTAKTEEEEFQKIYGIDVVVVPTNRPMVRTDNPDMIYRTEQGKLQAVVNEIQDCHRRSQPALVGTVSIEKSERLSQMLRRTGVPHQVLNAKYHDREAEIIALAGQPGAVTIATNMAGRGTDIVLGEGVAQNGGLYVIGTERHEARRIDNQLRGRSGRQGDPGCSRFFLSLEDDLMRLFGSDSIAGLMDRLGMDDSQPIDHPLVSRALGTAQKRVEARNFEIRRQVLEYDDVMNKQREVIYEQRRRILAGSDLRSNLMEMVSDLIGRSIDLHCHPSLDPEEWDVPGLIAMAEQIMLPPRMIRPAALRDKGRDEIRQLLEQTARTVYAERERQFGEELMREVERVVLLRVIDSKWRDHLSSMDDLRDGIGLRAYGQQDPLIEYRHEGFEMFQGMVEAIKEDFVRYAFKVRVAGTPERSASTARTPSIPGMAVTPNPASRPAKPGRNDPCPCGSGKKYKKCCGK